MNCAVTKLSAFATAWTVAQEAPLSMEFSSQEYWSGLPFLSLWDLPNPGIKLVLLRHLGSPLQKLQVCNIVIHNFYSLYSIYSYKILTIFPVLYKIAL